MKRTDRTSTADTPKSPPWWVLLDLAIKGLTATGGTITMVLALLEAGVV